MGVQIPLGILNIRTNILISSMFFDVLVLSGCRSVIGSSPVLETGG
jgi:hypothetical protein